jgi:DNA-binding LytR/AlgR family response regulator
MKELHPILNKTKKFLIVRKGSAHVLTRAEDIALIYVENKICFIVDAQEKKFFCEMKLYELQRQLNPNMFFRVNRQFIVNVNFIKSFVPIQNLRLRIDLKIATPIEVTVSQEMTPHFKKWIHNL